MTSQHYLPYSWVAQRQNPMKTRDHFWKQIPPLSLAVFLLGVFFIFGIIGSAVDVINMAYSQGGAIW
jgi:hypothetical protein